MSCYYWEGCRFVIDWQVFTNYMCLCIEMCDNVYFWFAFQFAFITHWNMTYLLQFCWFLQLHTCIWTKFLTFKWLLDCACLLLLWILCRRLHLILIGLLLHLPAWCRQALRYWYWYHRYISFRIFKVNIIQKFKCSIKSF